MAADRWDVAVVNNLLQDTREQARGEFRKLDLGESQDEGGCEGCNLAAGIWLVSSAGLLGFLDGGNGERLDEDRATWISKAAAEEFWR